MKKIFSLLLCVTMLAAALAVSTSAAGEIIWTEDFTNGFNPSYWIVEKNKFWIDEATSDYCLAAYTDGVVSQMEYRDDITGTPMRFNNFAFVTSMQIRDFDADGEHSAGLWWKDYFWYVAGDSGESPYADIQKVWNIRVNADDMTLRLLVEGEDAPRATAPITGIEVGGDWFTLGWRITPGRIQGYVNNQKLIDYTSSDIVASEKGPMLLLNTNCYVAFDKMVLATADYDLFGDGGISVPGDNGAGDNVESGNNNNNTPANTTTATSVVEVTNENGEVVTDESGNAVTSVAVITEAAPAATNTGVPAGGTSTSTGDMSFVVVAVMLTALGCAIIVKKVSVR